jgi:acyl dehydratase
MKETPSLQCVQVGHEFPPLTKDPITETQLVRYAGASGDFNPLHTVHAVGVKAGFGGVIAHGLLGMGFVGQAVTDWVPNRHLRNLNIRFKGVTRPGDAVTVSGRVVERLEGRNLIRCAVEARDQRGEVKIEGTFEAELPAR